MPFSDRGMPGRETRADAGPTEGTVGPLLDGAFGFFAWIAHLVAIYVVEALACGLGLVRADGGTRTALVAALVAATLVAAAVVALHAVRRWRRQRERQELRFRMSFTIGCDAIAAVAIVWQLLALALVPACA